MIIEMQPVGTVRGGRVPADDDDWGAVRSVIELDQARFTVEALLGLDSFSHAEIVYLFDRISDADITTEARHPRGNTDWPKVGIFAQRGRNRPNRIGVSVCRVMSVNGTKLEVEGLDAIDGTPVLDIKPVLTGFQPRGTIVEPGWATELMATYW